MFPKRSTFILLFEVIQLSSSMAQVKQDSNSVKNDGNVDSEAIILSEKLKAGQNTGDSANQLMCYDFDHSKCPSGVKENCTRSVNCLPEHLGHRTYCYSVIPMKNGVVRHDQSIMGCFSQPVSGTRYCTQDKCLAVARGTSSLYCCCTSNFCNGKMINAENATLHTETVPMFEEKIVPSYIEKSEVVPLAIVIVFILLALLMVLTCWCYFLLRIRPRRKAGAGVNSAGSADDAEQLLRIGNSQDTPDLSALREIGSGRFGKVYCCKMDGKWVAVKVFPKEEFDSWRTERDIYGINGLESHENILHFIRSMKRGDDFLIVADYHQKGCLYDYLKKNNLTLQEALKIIISMLTGLSFLHEERVFSNGSKKPCIVHRDFKSQNVLLKNDSTAVISDFGLAMICEDGRSPEGTRGQVGTRRYMSPEVLEGATEFSAFAFRQIDVYAAALVLWEIIKRTVFHSDDVADEYRQPYEDEMGLDPTIGTLRLGVVHKKIRPSIRDGIFRSKIGCGLWKTVEEMWNMEPDGRITAGCALERVKRLSTLVTVKNQTLSSREEADLSCMYNIRRKDSSLGKDGVSDSVYNGMYPPPNQQYAKCPS